MEKLVLTSQLRAALMAHDAWRSRLISAVLTGRGLIPASQAERDDACDLGRWLARLGDLPEVPQVEQVRQLHAHFHREAAEVMELAVTGHRDAALLAVGADSPLDRASLELTAAMKAWIAAL